MVSIPERVAISAAVILVDIPPVPKPIPPAAGDGFGFFRDFIHNRNQFCIWITAGRNQINLVDRLS